MPVDRYEVIFEAKNADKVRQEADRITDSVEEIDRAGKAASAGLGTSFTAMLGPLSGILRLLGPIAAGFTAWQGIEAVRAKIDELDQLAKSARALGTTVETLSSLRLGFDLAGLSDGERVLNVLNRRIAETAAGVGEARGLFKGLGVEVVDSNGKMRDGVSVLLDLAGAAGRLGSSTELAAAVNKIFGDELAKGVIPYLLQGKDAIQELREESDRLGKTMTTEVAESAERVNDAWTRLTARFEGFTNGLATATLPALADAVDELLYLLGLIDKTEARTKAGTLQGQIDLARTDQAFAQNLLQDPRYRTALGLPREGLIQPTVENRQALIAELERQLEIAKPITDAVAAVAEQRRRDRESLSLDAGAFAPTAQSGQTRGAAASARETTTAVSEAAESVDRYRQELIALSDAYGEVETATRGASTITIDLGEAFNRLTTGGGEFDLASGFRNAFQSALAEKLRFDLEIEQNFLDFIPSTIESGWDRVVGIIRGGTDEMVLEAERGARDISNAYGRGFQSVAFDGQQLARTLENFGFSTSRGVAIPNNVGEFGNLAGGSITAGPGGRGFAVTDAYGSTFIGGDLAAVSQVASGQTAGGAAGGSGGFGAGSAITGGAAILGAVIGELVTQLNEEEAVRIGRLQTTRPAGVDVGGLTTTGALAGLGVGAAVTGVGVATGAITGATLGSAVPVIGTIIGAALGALVGAIASLFETKPQRSDLIQKAIGDLVEQNPSFIEQGNFRVYRKGIESDRIFRPTEDRRAFFESLGISFDANTDQFTLEETLANDARIAGNFGNIGRDENGNLIQGFVPNPSAVALENLVLSDPNNLEELLRLPAYGLAAALTGGNAKDTADATNALINNILLTGQEFSEEAKRQLRVVADAAGLDLFNTIEQLGVNFTIARGRYDDRGGGKADIDREDTLRAIEGVVELFSDDIPKGVDVLALATEHLGEASFNTAGFFEDLTRQMEIFGDLAQGVDSAIKAGIGELIRARDPQRLLEQGASVDEVVRAGIERRAAGVSAVFQAIGPEIEKLLTEQIFDIIKESPAYDAITTAAAAGGAGIEKLIPQLVGQTIPLIDSALQGYRATQEALALAPTALLETGEGIRDQAERARFGRLSPEQQLSRLRGEAAALEEERQRLLVGGITADEQTRFREIAQERAQIGFAIAGLADQFGDNSATGRRRADQIFDEGISLSESSAKDFEKLATEVTNQVAATEANTQAIRDLNATLIAEGIKVIGDDGSLTIIEAGSPLYEIIAYVIGRESKKGGQTSSDMRAPANTR